MDEREVQQQRMERFWTRAVTGVVYVVMFALIWELEKTESAIALETLKAMGLMALGYLVGKRAP